MKIEMNKKYKTRNGHDVKIYEVYENEKASYVHGAYLENGLWVNTRWNIEGTIDWYIDKSLDLVEVKEDWEILIEHFNIKETPVFIVVSGEVCICAKMEECEYNREHCKSVLIAHHDNSCNNLHKKNIKMATIEDCKKFILEK